MRLPFRNIRSCPALASAEVGDAHSPPRQGGVGALDGQPDLSLQFSRRGDLQAMKKSCVFPGRDAAMATFGPRWGRFRRSPCRVALFGDLAVLVLFLLAPLAGCGYSSSSLYPTDIKTVAVPIWRNDTFRRQLEFSLTEAIDKNIEARSPYRLASRNRADSILTGRIINVTENVLTNRFATNLPQESQITIAVNFTWKDLHNGKILLRRKSFSATSAEIPQIGQQLSDAEQIAVERLARAIVNQMQKSW